MPEWLKIDRGAAPLIVSFPHTGTDIPANIEARLTSPWLARKDTDWWIDQLYNFASQLGATTVRTRISRTVIDVNRDPAGLSLYPGAVTTGLCPEETFDGEPLYLPGQAPGADDITVRRQTWFDPYHAALTAEIDRLRQTHATVVLYDAHAIRSAIPRLFDGSLPQFNIGTHSGASCPPALAERVAQICAASGRTWVLNGRFKGGWTTRHYGRPQAGIHAIQMELACRSYMAEPDEPLTAENWPSAANFNQMQPLAAVLSPILQTCANFSRDS